MVKATVAAAVVLAAVIRSIIFEGFVEAADSALPVMASRTGGLVVRFANCIVGSLALPDPPAWYPVTRQ